MVVKHARSFSSGKYSSTPSLVEDILPLGRGPGAESEHLVPHFAHPTSSDSELTTGLLRAPGRASTTSDRALRYWCYGLHAFLVAIHTLLVVLLFIHPEHRITIPVNNTAPTIALRVLLQAFYTIYTAALVLVVQRLAIFAAMAKQQKLTSIHDICGAWNGIGASINTLWLQTRVISSPLTIVMILTYLACISGLHIISSSVIQFEAFNNTITSVAPSTLAWPFFPLNLTGVDWTEISPLTSMWSLLPTAKGLSGNMLYDVPSSDYGYTGAVVDTSTITADCGLLSNTSVGYWDIEDQIYFVNVSGLGEVALSVGGPDLVYFTGLSSSQLSNVPPCPLCNSVVAFQISTGVDLGNLSSEVLQVNVGVPTASPVGATDLNHTIPTTAVFAACSLKAENTTQYLPMENGKLTQPGGSSANGSEAGAWSIWSPGPTTELTQMFNLAQDKMYFSPISCIQQPSGQQVCAYITPTEIYLNNLLGIPWIPASTGQVKAISPIVLQSKQIEQAIEDVAAALVWLGSTYITSGAQQTIGTSLITNPILELRMNINIVPVGVGLFASFMLLAIVAWMLHDSYSGFSNTMIAGSGMLQLMWISAHSSFLQNFMMKTPNSMSDQLRIEGIKAEVCLLEIEATKGPSDKANKLRMGSVGYLPNWQQFNKSRKFSMHLLCHILHALFFVLHVILVLLLIHHPEHVVTMSVYDTWVTLILSIFLQAFYVLYTAVLVFIVQQLATTRLISERQHLTTVHDITNAWTGVGAAISSLLWQKNPTSSILAMLGVVIYLACVSVVHIASTTIMQFTAYNSTSTIPVQTLLTWPNTTNLSMANWTNAIPTMPPMNMINKLQTTGLVNNTIYDVLNITQSTFMSATVNATSFQVNCGLLSNLSYSNNPTLPGLNFSVDGIGKGLLAFDEKNLGVYPVINEIVNIQEIIMDPLVENCVTCYQYLYYLITAHIEVDVSASSAKNLSYNIANEGDPPVMAYVAACSLLYQESQATLNVQTNTITSDLVPLSPLGSQTWKLWSPEPSNYINDALGLIANTPFINCPTDGGVCSMANNITIPEQNDSLYTLPPAQLEQTIEQSIAVKIWMAGQVGLTEGGFQRDVGQSPVTQMVTKWRLNINTIPAIFATSASLLLFALSFVLVGVSGTSSARHQRPSIDGVSVLEILWVAMHSQTIQERMLDVEEPSLPNLRRAGMFEICLGEIYASRMVGGLVVGAAGDVPAEDEAFLG